MSREEKKNEILRAAGQVFFSKGFEKTKIEDVAKQAGIGKGTVYEYFESKLQLFEEMIAYYHQDIIDSLCEALARWENIGDKIKAYAQFMTEMISNHIHLFELMADSRVMAREMGAMILESNIRMGDVLLEIVTEAMSKGELRLDLEPRLITSTILGTVNQYCSLKIMFSEPESQEIDYDRLVDAVMRGVGAEVG
ncbi:MAG: TetR/AcrR family transcriptional regulator [Peptococcaceae bacterium]|jgi:AcrR family transcriptional regulator|nr:TetR/AcrR family transcriptional regulator [Peptococcaceae bacterium]